MVFTGIFPVTGDAEHLCFPATPPPVTRPGKYTAHVEIWGVASFPEFPPRSRAQGRAATPGRGLPSAQGPHLVC